ncbi:MAG: CHAP domain-containing protein [bacterium]|nr:CHAP domain-containing protein [bacterium]
METSPEILQAYRDVLPILLGLRNRTLEKNKDTNAILQKTYFLLGLDESVALEEAIDRIQRLLLQTQRVEQGEVRLPDTVGQTRWERKDIVAILDKLDTLTRKRNLQRNAEEARRAIVQPIQKILGVIQETQRLDPERASVLTQSFLKNLNHTLNTADKGELEHDEDVQGVVLRSLDKALEGAVPENARKKILRIVQEETAPSGSQDLYTNVRRLKTSLFLLQEPSAEKKTKPPAIQPTSTLRLQPVYSPQPPQGFFSTITNEVLSAQGGLRNPADIGRIALAEFPLFSKVKRELFLFSFRGLADHDKLTIHPDDSPRTRRIKTEVRTLLSGLPDPTRTWQGRALQWFWGDAQRRFLPTNRVLDALITVVRQAKTANILTQEQFFLALSNATAPFLGPSDNPTYTFQNNQWVFAENPMSRIPLPLPSPFANWFKNSFSSSLIYLRRHGAASIFGAYAGAGGGAMVGGITGAAVGGAVGAPFGPVGVTIGQFTGGAVGGSTGFVIGPSLGGPTFSFFVRMWNTLWSPFGSPNVAASKGISAAGRGLAGLGRSALGALGPRIAQGLAGLGARMATGFAAGLSATGWGIVIAVAAVLILIGVAYFYNTNFIIPGSFVSGERGGTDTSLVTGGSSTPYTGPFEEHPASQVVIKIQQSPCKGTVRGTDQVCIDWIKTNLQNDLATEIVNSAISRSNDFFLQCVGLMRGLASAFNNLIPDKGGHARQYADIWTRPTNYDYIDKTTGQTIQPGDIAIWAYGEFGHIAYVVGVEREDKTQFVVAEANNCRPDCGRVGISTRNVNETNFTGWLRKKTQ